MARLDTLGEFEQLVLLAIVHLENEAYGVTIRREIEARTGRSIAVGPSIRRSIGWSARDMSDLRHPTRRRSVADDRSVTFGCCPQVPQRSSDRTTRCSVCGRA